MKLKSKTLLIIFLIVIGCKNKAETSSQFPIYNPTRIDLTNYKKIDFNLYKLMVPTEWNENDVEGIDSYVTQLITTDLDLISSDLGWHSNSLDTDSKVSETTSEYYRLNNKVIKIVKPIKSGTGITGVYIKNLWKKNGEMEHFNLYGIDLSEKSEKELLLVISTIEFKEF